MATINADLRKLKSLFQEDWNMESFHVRFAPGLLDPKDLQPQMTIVMSRGKTKLTLLADEQEVFDFCSTFQVSLDEDGNPTLRKVVDNNRYFRELEHFIKDVDQKRQQAMERCSSGKCILPFNPEQLVPEFVAAKEWGSPRYLPLKEWHFDVQAAVLISAKRMLNAQDRLVDRYPQSKRYADQVEHLLREAFGNGDNPVRTYRSLMRSVKGDLPAIAQGFLTEARQSEDLFGMLAQRGKMRGDIGFPYLIDVYRRYAEWSRPLIILLSDAVCHVEKKPLPDPLLGFTKRCELIQRSQFASLVDCLDPRIRNAASHNSVKYDHGRGMVQFAEVDANGKQVSEFEVTYAEMSDKAQQLKQGFIPGLLGAVGIRQHTLLFLTVMSKDYVNLLLLIDNVAA